jgi:hypothetical protein
MELDRNQLPQLGFVASLQLGPTLIAKLTQARNKEVERSRTPAVFSCVAVATWGELLAVRCDAEKHTVMFFCRGVILGGRTRIACSHMTRG